MHKKTIYVGFDGTLCVNKGIYPGAPIKPMVDRVKRWIQEGHTVKIFTARVDQETFQAERINVRIVTDWCEREGLVNLDGSALVITNRKGRDCDEIWDDRAVSVNEYGNYTSMRKTAAALDATVEDTVKSATAVAQAAYQKHLQTGAIQQGERPLTGSQTATPGLFSATNAVYRQRQAVPPSAPLEQDFGGQATEAPLGTTFGVGYSHTPGTTAAPKPGQVLIAGWLAATNEVDPPQDTVPSHGDDTLFEDLDAALTALLDDSDIFPDPRTR